MPSTEGLWIKLLLYIFLWAALLFTITFCSEQMLTSCNQHSPTQRIPVWDRPFVLFLPRKIAVVSVLTFFVHRQCFVPLFFLATHESTKVVSELCGNYFLLFFYKQKHMNRAAQKLSCCHCSILPISCCKAANTPVSVVHSCSSTSGLGRGSATSMSLGALFASNFWLHFVDHFSRTIRSSIYYALMVTSWILNIEFFLK